MKKLSLFLLLSTFTFCGFAQNMDIDLLREINLNRNTKLDPFFKGISDSDAPVSLLVPTVLFVTGLFVKDSLTTLQKSFTVGTSLVLASGLSVGLKYAINRPRPFRTYPDLDNVLSPYNPSFPSGHTTAAFSIATSLTMVYPKWYVAVPAYLWAGSIAYSRMHLGVHYPSDVLVGALIGGGMAWLSHYLNKKYFHRTASYFKH
ncbi:MAG: phosphatase PAP2 family protein [Cytophagales bacterium]|nr:phosphatase PAP2 family protein [Cytophagales bacterium]